MSIRPLFLLLCASLAIVAAGCGGDDMGGMDHGSGSGSQTTAGSTAGSSSTGTFNDADVAFAQNMIVHHQQAVEMAGLPRRGPPTPRSRNWRPPSRPRRSRRSAR